MECMCLQQYNFDTRKVSIVYIGLESWHRGTIGSSESMKSFSTPIWTLHKTIYNLYKAKLGQSDMTEKQQWYTILSQVRLGQVRIQELVSKFDDVAHDSIVFQILEGTLQHKKDHDRDTYEFSCHDHRALFLSQKFSSSLYMFLYSETSSLQNCQYCKNHIFQKYIPSD